MPYYHVLASFQAEPQRLRCIFKDLSESELEARFLTPYREGHSALAGIEILPLVEIRSIQIIRTERQNEAELKDIQAKSNGERDEFNSQSESVVLMTLGRGYHDEDIVEAGVNVTSTYITAPPGSASATKPSKLNVVLNHPWVLTVVGGLIVAGLVAWFRW